MEDDEKIVAPEEEVLENLETNSTNEQGSTEDELKTEEPKESDRVSILEDQVQELNARFDDVVTEQEKIVTVLDKISDKILASDVKPVEEKTTAKKNDIEESEETPQEDESEDALEEPLEACGL